MVREIDSCRLTDKQLEALDVLSIDYGLTNRELNRWLKESSIPSNLTEQELKKAREKIEKNEGNFSRDVTGPLLERGIIYQMEGEYPNKLLYINKFIDNMHKIQRDLAYSIEGRIWYYDKIHHIEHAKMEMKSRKTSEKHAEAHGVLTSFIRLYYWCDQIIKEIDNSVKTHQQHYDSFCLVTQIPPCKRCRVMQKGIKLYQYHQESQRILFQQDRILALMKARVQHGINNVKELQLVASHP